MQYLRTFSPKVKRFEPKVKRFKPKVKRFKPKVKRFEPKVKRFEGTAQKRKPIYRRYSGRYSGEPHPGYYGTEYFC